MEDDPHDLTTVTLTLRRMALKYLEHYYHGLWGPHLHHFQTMGPRFIQDSQVCHL